MSYSDSDDDENHKYTNVDIDKLADTSRMTKQQKGYYDKYIARYNQSLDATLLTIFSKTHPSLRKSIDEHLMTQYDTNIYIAHDVFFDLFNLKLGDKVEGTKFLKVTNFPKMTFGEMWDKYTKSDFYLDPIKVKSYKYLHTIVTNINVLNKITLYDLYYSRQTKEGRWFAVIRDSMSSDVYNKSYLSITIKYYKSSKLPSPNCLDDLLYTRKIFFRWCSIEKIVAPQTIIHLDISRNKNTINIYAPDDATYTYLNLRISTTKCSVNIDTRLVFQALRLYNFFDNENPAEMGIVHYSTELAIKDFPYKFDVIPFKTRKVIHTHQVTIEDMYMGDNISFHSREDATDIDMESPGEYEEDGKYSYHQKYHRYDTRIRYSTFYVKNSYFPDKTLRLNGYPSLHVQRCNIVRALSNYYPGFDLVESLTFSDCPRLKVENVSLHAVEVRVFKCKIREFRYLYNCDKFSAFEETEDNNTKLHIGYAPRLGRIQTDASKVISLSTCLHSNLVDESDRHMYSYDRKNLVTEYRNIHNFNMVIKHKRYPFTRHTNISAIVAFIEKSKTPLHYFVQLQNYKAILKYWNHLKKYVETPDCVGNPPYHYATLMLSRIKDEPSKSSDIARNNLRKINILFWRLLQKIDIVDMIRKQKTPTTYNFFDSDSDNDSDSDDGENIYVPPEEYEEIEKDLAELDKESLSTNKVTNLGHGVRENTSPLISVSPKEYTKGYKPKLTLTLPEEYQDQYNNFPEPYEYKWSNLYNNIFRETQHQFVEYLNAVDKYCTDPEKGERVVQRVTTSYQEY